MVGRWFARGSGAAARRPAAAPIGDEDWHAVQASLPFLAEPGLRERTAEFLARKAINPALSWPKDLPALEVSARLAIAAQASLPVLELGLDFYDDFAEVVVYPGEFQVKRERMDEDGVVHDESGAYLGETSRGGPVVVGWNPSTSPRTNVVVHEFAHKLDLASGPADGTPRFHPKLHDRALRAAWAPQLERSYDAFCDLVDDFEDRFPRHLDPESPAGLALYDALPLDAYATSDPGEFLAVSSEAFFVDPNRLMRAMPEWATLLARYYRPSRG